MSKSLETALALLDTVGSEIAGTFPAVTRLDTQEKKNSARYVSLRCGSQIVPQPIRWVWDGWLPAGKLTILAGAAGTGKTTLALGLAATLTAQGQWPDDTSCLIPGNILIWSSEDNVEDTLVPRLIAAGADMTRCHFIDGVTFNNEKLPFDPAEDMHDLNKAVDQIGGVALLIIDPIVSAVSGDMHRANDVRRALQAVVDFADIHNCAVIGITHFAKGGAGKAPADRVIGSQAFGALARMVLVAAKEEGGERRVLARAKSNITPDNGGIAYSIDLTEIANGIESTRARWMGAIEGTAREILGEVEHDDGIEEVTSAALERLLIDLITEHGGSMPAKLVKAEVSDAGYSWTAANRAKARIGIQSTKELGNKTGKWHWSLPKSRPTRIPENEKKPEESMRFSADSCVSSNLDQQNFR